MSRYIPQEIEPKWQAQWAADEQYKTKHAPDKEKCFAVTMLL